MCFAYLVKYSLYHPPAETMAAPLPPRHKDNRPSELKVGYGEAALEALDPVKSGSDWIGEI